MSIAAAERPLQKPIAPENHPLVSAFREIKAPVQTSRPPRAARTIKQPMAVQGKIGNTELAEIQVCLFLFESGSCCASLFQVCC